MDDDASIHDRLLWAIHISGFDDLVKFLASAQSEQQWSMHVLEIISLMFRDQVRLHNPSTPHVELQLLHCVRAVPLSFRTDAGGLSERRAGSFCRTKTEGLSGAGGTEAA